MRTVDLVQNIRSGNCGLIGQGALGVGNVV